jgi:polyphosphate glucokinase
MLTERYRIPTPEGAKPEEVAETISEVVKFFNWKGDIGIGFPAAIRDGVALTAANIHKDWIGVHIPTLIKNYHKANVFVLNDADAAGLAEMTFGAGRNLKGSVLIVTVGTGIGTALFHNGELFPNTELGHIEIGGVEAEKYASDAVRKDKDLDWHDWAVRFNTYLQKMEALFFPKTIIIGGGISKKTEKFVQYLDVKAAILPAMLKNEAGIIGAAVFSRRS